MQCAGTDKNRPQGGTSCFQVTAVPFSDLRLFVLVIERLEWRARTFDYDHEPPSLRSLHEHDTEWFRGESTYNRVVHPLPSQHGLSVDMGPPARYGRSLIFV